ncbi:MAG: alpha/beta fold hydrolase [Acidobacteria bacterium]|nr:alpha/beta fold hydrolase [Acidobacteriota bacterium]
MIGAPDATVLEAVSELLMKEQPVACGARLDCISFPALTTVTVDVGVTVNGDARWVPWGSTLRAIAPADAAAGVRVFRRHGAAGLLPVHFDAEDPQTWLFPLLPRDRVEWPPVPGGDGPPVVERVAMSGPGGTIPVAFDVRGAGKTALVFIHCWACDRAYWLEQTREFSRSYPVVTLDLPGHGRFAAPAPPRFVLNQADHVVAVVKDLALDRVILVGHSMGAHVALAAVPKLRGVVRGVVIVESLHDAGVRPTAAMIDPIAGQLQADFPKAIEAMVRTQFRPGVNDAARDWLIARARKADPAAALALLRDYVNVDAAALLKLAAADVPVRAINTAATKTPGLTVTMMENAGHFPQLERPAEFNAALREVLAQWVR